MPETIHNQSNLQFNHNPFSKNPLHRVRFLSLRELAELLHMSQQSVRNLLSTQPHRLPKPIRINGLRRLYFSMDTVERFLLDNCYSYQSSQKVKQQSE